MRLEVPGAGAAGGTGAGLLVFCKAKLEPGIDLILNLLQFDHYLAKADLVLTGEGRMDGQTQYNKAPFGVMRAAKKFGVPVVAIAGCLGPGYEILYEYGLESITPICISPVAVPPENAFELLVAAVEQTMRTYTARGPKPKTSNCDREQHT